MSIEILHTFHHRGMRYLFVNDEHHATRGSYGYDTPEETKAAEDEELAKLESGEWVVLGILVSEPCEGVMPVEARTSMSAQCANSWHTDTVRDPVCPACRATMVALHCACCNQHKGTDGKSWIATDSLWGVVIENDHAKWEQFVKDGGL